MSTSTVLFFYPALGACRPNFAGLRPLLTLSILVSASACNSEVTAPPQMKVSAANPSAAASVDSLPEAKSSPVVELNGTSHAEGVTLIEAGAQRVYSRSLRSWIYERPDRDAPKLGYLRAGGSAPLRGPSAGTKGCKGGFYPIKPAGFVCLDETATLAADDPIVAYMSLHPPEFGRKLPYMYGTVRNPGPLYARLPNEQELRKVETDIDERMPRWLDAGGEVGASYAQHVWSGDAEPADPRAMWEQRSSVDVPEELADAKMLPRFGGKVRDEDALAIGSMRPKTGYSLLETFFWQGRRYGVSAELEVIPTDRLRPIQGSDFHGFEVGKDVKFPFAIVRSPQARFRDGTKATYRAALPLTGQQLFVEGVLHYETRDGQWIADRFASRLDPAKNMPGWATKGEKWIDVNITKQTMVLYEGVDPVFATLISTGEAGLEDAAHTTATKQGIFRIHTKHVTATMSSAEIGEEFELQDVPYVQYFDKEGYAIHGAYWHDRFGIPKSHGCINLAPEDARRLFHWTEPHVPVGWHGALLPLRGTVVFIHP
jgi:hypothetical protein